MATKSCDLDTTEHVEKIFHEMGHILRKFHDASSNGIHA